MCNVKYNRKQLGKYLAWTFILAYILQSGAAYVITYVSRSLGRMLLVIMMFVPTLGVLLSGERLKGMGWRLKFGKNIKNILLAWFAPIILTALGAGLYFLVFPAHFDLSGEYAVVSGAAEAIKQMKDQGISYPVYVLISVIGGITYAPLFNTFVALGEEVGWRGFLYPQLKARYGKRKGWILEGIIWGAWHWPLIWLIGYEYGAATGNMAGYVGFPIVGMLLFCIITVAWGILQDRLYEKSGSIWLPSIFHGAINAAASLPLAVCLANTGSARLLGPAPMGLLAGLPFLIVAGILLRQTL